MSETTTVDVNIKELLDDLNSVVLSDKLDEENDNISRDMVVQKTQEEKPRKVYHGGKGLATIQDDEILSPEEFNEELTRNLQHDYRYSRDKIKSMIDRIEKVYAMAIEEALATGDAKQISSLSSLFKSIIDSSTKLIDVSDKYRDAIVDNIDPDKDASPDIQNNVQTNNYFYGTFENVLDEIAGDNSLANRFVDDKSKDDK